MSTHQVTGALIDKVAAALEIKDQNIPQPEAVGIDVRQLREAVRLFRAVVFPGYFGGESARELLLALGSVIARQSSRACRSYHHKCDIESDSWGQEVASALLGQIPELRRQLGCDVRAIFDGDPAATSFEEIILTYPGLWATVHYRLAHALFRLGVPILPRLISELAHSQTGIDIHPGAEIGDYFSIDHGTGIVVGETSIIGSHVRLYQGVTLGAKSFRYNPDGSVVSEPRHPIIEDGVVVYSNSSILGRITIGRNSVIGGNVWQTTSLPPNSRVLQGRPMVTTFEDGGGI